MTYPAEIRRATYTTNVIESVNSSFLLELPLGELVVFEVYVDLYVLVAGGHYLNGTRYTVLCNYRLSPGLGR